MRTDPQRWARVRQLVEEALERPEAERAPFLAAACQGDEPLHREAASLMAAAQTASSFIERPPDWLAADAAPLEPGTQVDRYRILSLLGRGGMGDVYLAEDQDLSRKVALKFLPEELAADSGRLRRFEHEARAASALSHPNIVTIHEIHRGGPAPYFVTEYVEGQTLGQQLADGPLDVGTALDRAIQIAAALAAAHGAGIIHRDVKPDNVMVRPDGLVKVLDFGLAKRGGPEPPAGVRAPAARREAPNLGLTNPGTVMGTASYMSPEQARGLDVDARTDLFSFGAVLYEMVTGARPFEGVNLIDVLASVLARDPRSVKELRPDAPDGLQAILDKLLCKDVAGRYASADAVLADLKALRRDTEPRSSPRPRMFGAFRWTKTAAAIVIVTIAAVAMYSVSTPTAALTDQDFILLADFSNQTGDAAFDNVLEQALAVQLEQSPFLSTFPAARVVDTQQLLNGPDDRRLNRDTAREIGRRLGIKVIVAGSIARSGNGYMIGLEAFTSDNGELVARVQRDATGKEQVLTALGVTASDIRRKLGEPPASIQRFNTPIAQAATASLDAFKAFSLGRKHSARGLDAEAMAFHRQAVELDPTFALAWSQLTNLYSGATERARQKEDAAQAFRLRDRVSERHRLLITGDYHTFVTREVAKAVQVYEQLLETYPRDLVAAAKLGNRYVSLGLNEAAVEQLQKVVAVDPRGPAALQNLARALLRLNRFSEADAVLQAARHEKIDTRQTRQADFDLAFVRGDRAAMQRAIVGARGQEEEFHRTFDEAQVALFGGRFREAQGLFRRAGALAVIHKMEPMWHGGPKAGVALGHAALGHCDDARTEALEAAPLTVVSPAIWILAQCGDIPSAQALYDQASQATGDNVVVRDVRFPALQAMMLLRGHHPERVLQVMTRSPYEAAEGVLPEPNSFAPSWLRGQAFLELKNGTAAAAEFQRILDHRGWAPKSGLWPLAHLGLARALAMNSNRDESRARYEQFLDLWKDADPDAPALIDARHEFQALSPKR